MNIDIGILFRRLRSKVLTLYKTPTSFVKMLQPCQYQFGYSVLYLM